MTCPTLIAPMDYMSAMDKEQETRLCSAHSNMNMHSYTGPCVALLVCLQLHKLNRQKTHDITANQNQDKMDATAVQLSPKLQGKTVDNFLLGQQPLVNVVNGALIVTSRSAPLEPTRST